tara:strand:- start:670 stop:2241 length:1572 start_codon:yes stop_codon:yes gene_type:complete
MEAMKLVTAAEMQTIEKNCVKSGISVDNLMENAGVAVAEAIRKTPKMEPDIYGKRIVALIGSGNNGSDGLIACRLLSTWGARVTVFLCATRKSSDPKRDLAENSGVTIVDGLSKDGIKSLKSKLQTTDLVIDAVLGTGASRPIAEPLSSLLFCAVESPATVIAVDLPTGLNSDSGEFDNAGLPADITLMLGYPKLGSAILADVNVIGEKIVLDIGIPEDVDSQVKAELLTKDLAVSMLPVRPDQGHKGQFGSTLIIGGSQQYLGAVTLATEAATRSGAGLTFVTTPEPAYRVIGGHVPEAIYQSLPVSQNSDINPSKACSIALNVVKNATSAVIGPGLGNNRNTFEFVSSFLSQIDDDIPVVIDADALNILAESHQWWNKLKIPCVLTPHPGEMGRLMGISSLDVQQNRVAVALEAAEKFQKIVVLKGASTVIAAPGGRFRVSPWVNSGLAKGGSGDTLAGLLGGLLAQHPDKLLDMASLAVYIHGYAADIARRELGETSMRATDVSNRLGYFYRDFMSKKAN